MTENKKMFFYLSFIRGLACISIVILHCFKYASALSTNDEFKINDTQIIVSNIMQYVMNGAVPCFVMITGALLLDNDKQISYRKLFSKYIFKTVSIIFVFSIFFQLIDDLLTTQSISIQVIFIGLKNAVFNKSWFHMWYLYMLISIYLMLPIYRKITANINKKDIFYLLILYGVFCIVFDILNNGIGYSYIMNKSDYYSTNELINLINDVSSPAFYIFEQKVWPFYLFLGYTVHKEFVNIKPVVSIVMLLTGVLLIVTMNLMSNSLTNSIAVLVCNVLCSFNSSPVFLLISLGAFSFIKSIYKSNFNILNKIIVKIDLCSFGIYLIHLLPIKILLVKFKFNPYNYGGTLGVILFSFVIILTSFFVVFLYKKLKIIISDITIALTISIFKIKLNKRM